jgi:serine-type D-Ala-D-Ala carboxypeptidase/endopeptidase (penicillin-binding protein 4)
MRRRIAAVLLTGLVVSAGLIAVSARAVPRPPPGEPEAAAASPPSPPAPSRSPRTTASPQATTSPTPEPDPYVQLRAWLEALVAGTPLAPGATVAVAVLDERGREIFNARADEPLLPASAQKLVPAAAALELLGPDHRFSTTVLATGPIGPDGTLDGNLLLVGGGDPVLASPVFATQVEPERPHTPLSTLADQIVAAGVRRVTGQVVGDASAFADEPLPTGWLPEYLDELDGVPTSALTMDAGRALGIRDGRLVGDPEPDPAFRAAAQLSWLLGERGVPVDAGAGSTRAPLPAVAELARVESPPLADLLTEMMQTSDNQIADQIFRSLGAAVGEPTWDGSADAARAALAGLDLDWDGVWLADGSGLSRDNRLTARFLTELDLAMTEDAMDRWQAMQAIAGQSGTLRRRLAGTIAEGRLWGKTGSLRDVRALTGTIAGPHGERRHVTVMGNGLDGPSAEAVRGLTDQIVLTLTGDLYDCQRVQLQPAGVEWHCAA